MSNPYSVLGIRPGASPDEVRAAFRALARTYHPDMTRGDEGAGRRMAEINSAYDALRQTVATPSPPPDPSINRQSYLRPMTDAEGAALLARATEERRAALGPRQGRLRAPWRKGPRVAGPPILTLSGIRVEDDLMRFSFDGAARVPEVRLVLPMLHWMEEYQMRVSVDPPRVVPLEIVAPVRRLDVDDPGTLVSGWTGTLRLLFGA